MIFDSVKDRLGLAPGGNNSLFPQYCQMLRQSGLRQVNALLNFSDTEFAVGQLAQHHQPFLIAQHTQQIGCAASTCREQGGIKAGQINHGL